MLRDIYINNNLNKLFEYSLKIFWSNQLFNEEKISKDEYLRLQKNIKKEYENIS